MKVLLITESLGSGGAERQLVGLSSLLKQKGYDVTVITYVMNQFHEQFLKDNSIQYQLLPELQPKLFRVFRMTSMFHKHCPDVVISYLPHVNKAVCLSKIFCKFKLLVSERTHTYNFNFETKIRFFLYRIADFVIPNSFYEAENISSHFPFLKKKIVPIPNYVDTNVFCPKKKTTIQDGFTRLLSVGRIIPSKNVLPFLEVFASLIREGHQLQLKWVGSMYDEDYCNQVKKRISQLHLENLVTLQDQTSNIALEYQIADVFCFPTLYEGYPNVLVEAMSCGMPVVCSNVCEMPSIVNNGENGYLFDPTSFSEMKNALIKILDMSTEERDRIGITNRRYVLKNNTSEVFVQKYINLF